MAPKKTEAGGGTTDSLVGFEPREIKLLAAAFVSSVGVDKYDYELFATLTGNTAGSLRKMWPPVKRKAVDAHETFGTFLGAGETTKVPASKKRKAVSETGDDDADVKDAESGAAEGAKKSRGRSKKVPETDGDAEEVKDAESGAAEGTKKGRSKKVPETGDDDADAKDAESGAAEGTKKGRGRSKKVPETKGDADDDKKKAPAKGRGRPKKVKSDKGDDNKDDNAAEDEVV